MPVAAGGYACAVSGCLSECCAVEGFFALPETPLRVFADGEAAGFADDFKAVQAA